MAEQLQVICMMRRFQLFILKQARMSLRTIIASSINRILFRQIHLSTAARGTDSREKRLAHVKKSDKLEGEYAAIAATHAAYEPIDENLMD